MCFWASSQAFSGQIQDNNVLVERPDVKEGDTYTYTRISNRNGKILGTFTQRVVRVTHEHIIVEMMVGGTPVRQTYTRDWNLVETKDVKFTPYRHEHKFPIVKNDSWSGKSKQKNDNGNDFYYESTGIVEGTEKVRVPAGTFTAIKTRVDTTYEAYTANGSGRGTITRTFWYAPRVNRFIKFVYEDTNWRGLPFRSFRWELVAFERE